MEVPLPGDKWLNSRVCFWGNWEVRGSCGLIKFLQVNATTFSNFFKSWLLLMNVYVNFHEVLLGAKWVIKDESWTELKLEVKMSLEIEWLIITLGLKVTHSVSVRGIWQVNRFAPAHIINNFEALLKNCKLMDLIPKTW